ncbi:uncharacterized protein LOC120333790 isoform X2 [Styela clava]
MPDTPTKEDVQTCEENGLDDKEKIDVIADDDTTPINENNEEAEEEPPSSTRSQPTEESEQPGDSPNTNTAIIKRRYRKINRPLYYIGGNNGTQIVDEFLSSLGWERISDKTRDDYRLKWCEIKSHNNYYSFREGDQLCYQIPNNKVLTTKIGLLTSLQEYDRVMNKVKKGRPRIMKYQDFFPETYRMDVKEERDMFYELYKDGEIWISKPTGLNQGKGIYLIRDREDISKFQEKMADIEEEVQTTRKLPFKVPMARIVQRYITNPLLLDGKKFDVRNYMLVSSTQPFVVFYCDGYCRLTCLPYDERSTDLTGHLTNQFMQKKNPLYQEIKDETVWSMDRFNEYVNKHHMDKNKLPQDWVHTVLRKRCQQIMLHCFQSVRHKLECKLGFFDMYGCDFLVDDKFKISLLEFNCNPALHTNCDILKEVIPGIVTESLKLALEIFNKSKAKERIMPLTSQERVILLYNGDLIEAEERREKLRSAAEARKRARSAQRRKKFMANFNMRYAYGGRRGSDGEGETNTNPTTNVTNTTTSTTNVTSRLANPKQSLSTESILSVTTASQLATYHVSGSRSQTSLSTTSSNPALSQSPPRVVQSRSLPNVSQKKPFYAGAPRFQRKANDSRKSNNNNNSVTQNKTTNVTSTTNAEDSLVTEESVAASLDAKLHVYRKTISTNTKHDEKRKEKSPEMDKNEKDSQQTRGRARERYRYNAMITKEKRDNSSPKRQERCDYSDDSDQEKTVAMSKKLLEAMSPSSLSAMQAPSAKLPLNYHNKVPMDNEFSKKYLAGIANAKKGQNKIAKNNTTMKNAVFKTPLPSALPFHSRDTGSYFLPSSEQIIQQQKVQYRTPTTVRVRQTLQATTCTLEIGPKSRRGLVAIPTTATTTPLVQTQRTQTTKNNQITKLRMINATAAITSPSLELEDNPTLPGVRINLDEPQLQVQSSAHNGLLADSSEPKSKATCVDSSTQTPVSNSSLSSEEKVIWRLRTRIGANNNNVRHSNRSSMPSNEMSTKSLASFPSSMTGIKTYNNQLSPRYIAVRPSLGNGVTLAISPPALISGKNMLPVIQENKTNNEVNNAENSPRVSEISITPQLSQHSQTSISDPDYELPSGATVRTILDGVARAKLEDNSERWMAPG